MFVKNLKNISFFLFLVIFLFIIYFHSFHAEFFFDDFSNIVNNPNVHLRELSWDNISRCFYGRTQATIDRPLVFLTLGINYYFGRLETFGYHVTNWLIHITTTFFLFMVIYNTLKMHLKTSNINGVFFISFISTLFWAANPIHVLAVASTVQRMASLSGMFFIIAFYSYIKARTCTYLYKRYVLYCLSFLLWLLGFISKETIFTLPFIILIYDLFFIQGLTRHNVFKFSKLLGMSCLFLLIPALLILKFHQFPLLDLYKFKSFTLTQRLLTEPRVFLFYLSLIFFPSPDRLTLIHDFPTSTSLFNPVSTFISIILILFIISLTIYKANKNPVLAFTVLFYFSNHLMEGSFICLDLVYEYRNYIPSMFLYVPVAMILFDFYNSKNRIIIYKTIILLIILIYACIEGFTTYHLNNIYKNRISLWQDNAKKSPDLFTPHHNLASIYFEKNRIQEALKKIIQAKKSKPDISIGVKSNADILLANIYSSKGHFDLAIKCLKKALKKHFDDADLHHELSIAYGEKALFKDAYFHIKKAIKIQNNSPDLKTRDNFIFTYCSLLKAEGKLDNAIAEATKALKRYKSSINLPYFLAECYRNQGKYKKALETYNYCLKLEPSAHQIRFDLITLCTQQKMNVLLKNHIDFIQKAALNADNSFFSNYYKNTNDVARIEIIKNIFPEP